eukprot:5954889-Prymnesium_polylepis.1
MPPGPAMTITYAALVAGGGVAVGAWAATVSAVRLQTFARAFALTPLTAAAAAAPAVAAATLLTRCSHALTRCGALVRCHSLDTLLLRSDPLPCLDPPPRPGPPPRSEPRTPSPPPAAQMLAARKRLKKRNEAGFNELPKRNRDSLVCQMQKVAHVPAGVEPRHTLAWG